MDIYSIHFNLGSTMSLLESLLEQPPLGDLVGTASQFVRRLARILLGGYGG